MKNKKLYAVAAVVLLAALVTGVTAYLNDSETHDDPITLSDSLRIDLIQPAWKPLPLENVRPRQTFDKDPRVVNRSSFDIYAFIEILMPYVDDLLVQDNQGKVLNADRPGGALYSYAVHPGWTQLAEPTLALDGEGRKCISYVYAWMRDGALTPLKAGETTEPLFEHVSVVNYTHATLPGGSQDITMNAFGLDASVVEDTDPAAPKSPQAMWRLLKNTYPTPTPRPTATAETTAARSANASAMTPCPTDAPATAPPAASTSDDPFRGNAFEP